MDLRNKVKQTFIDRYGRPPSHIVRAPGRVNLIGEHTDYNDGFVLPMAIDRYVWIALRPAESRRVEVYSIDFEEQVNFRLDALAKDGPGWVEYIRGVAWVLLEEGYPLTGWQGVLVGDVPIGAGLSSSAAIELATARAFSAISGWDWKPKSMAAYGQLAENEWVGMNCGIMDQMISAVGKQGHALLIDCRTLETKLVPLPQGVSIVVLDTKTRRGLVDSAYNERRAQCEAAAAHFSVPALRDVSWEMFENQATHLDPLIRRRARHVITENGRTLQATLAMEQNDPIKLGTLMVASHDSLRDDFEVSNTALNVMVETARSSPGCYGARMTGAGFGGCAVAVVEADQVDEFIRQVSPAYEQKVGLQAEIYVCSPTDGAQVL
jgi:galactokinase